MPATFEHAYYLSCYDTTFGSDTYKEDLKELFMGLCAGFFDPKNGAYRGSHFDGISRFDTPEGIRVRFTLKNLFDANPKAFAYLDT